MQNPHRYFTTPIYYANGNAHAGHIYTTILASILKKHYTTRGMTTRFLTGLDEHGEAVEQKAKELNKNPQDHVNMMAQKWVETFSQFHIDYDVFLRTTSPEHKKNVTEILNYCHKKGDIYYGEHEGYYCVKCESFLSNSERNELNECLIHKLPTEQRKEGNYFFKISKYRSQLKKLIENNEITQQDRYKNELLSLLEHFEGDLSISRPKTRLTWGIELPFDSSHVTYVWFDALPNYVTGIGGLTQARTNPFWHHAYHLLGKDILKFHGIFWPAMCLSLDIPTPKLLLTGWILKDGHKMSKSLGNVLTVDEILHYGRDMFTNYVFRVTNPGEDIDISWKSYFERFNSDLANGIGNLASRTFAMIEKYFHKKIPQFHQDILTDEQSHQAQFISKISISVAQCFDDFRIADALHEIWKIISNVDKYITDQKPWNMAKDGDPFQMKMLSNVLATACASLRAVAFLAYPFFPEKMLLLLVALGENTQKPSHFYENLSRYFTLHSGFEFQEIPKLYQRIDVVAELKIQNAKAENLKPLATEIKVTSETVTKKLTEVDKPTPVAPIAELNIPKTIEFNDFAKIDLRVGTVVSAELVEKSDKLLKLSVSLGERGLVQVFSGIRAFVKPEEIVNKKVILVANLEPRKMKFGMSEAMLLTAEGTDGQVKPVYLSEDLKEGSQLV